MGRKTNFRKDTNLLRRLFWRWNFFRKKFQLFKQAQMEGKYHQSRSRSISHAKNPKPRGEENRFSFEKQKKHQNGSSSSSGRQQRQQKRGGSIMRKKQKKFEEGGKQHQLNKDDMQLTIENIMLLSGIAAINVFLRNHRRNEYINFGKVFCLQDMQLKAACSQWRQQQMKRSWNGGSN